MDREVDLEKVVDGFGGFSGLARAMGLSLSTVHAWARRSDEKGNPRIPIWRQREIIALARKKKLKDIYRDRPKKKKQRKKVA